MERLRTLIRNWLGFSRTEANGFIIMIPLLFIILFSEPAYRSWVQQKEDDFSADEKKLDSLVALWDDNENVYRKVEEHKAITIEKFPFNPNNISENEMESLGFSKRLSNRIANYRQKGGVFRVKSDLMKIYGMDSTLYHQLYAFIDLPEKLDQKKFEKKEIEKSRRTFEAFDINTADTSHLKRIYGIGPALALRIIRFRESLGGFITKDQLAEVYGLDTAVVNRLSRVSFIDKSFQPRKINLNNTDEKLLSAHPYIKRSLAKAITAYRFQHGKFSDVKELEKISIITPHEAEKLIPYLTVND